MTTKFTPGPWRTRGYSIHGAENGVCVASVMPPSPWLKGRERHEEREYCEGNARLVAASPEMFSLLVELVSIDSNSALTITDADDFTARLQLVIAKVRGAQ